MDAKGGPTVLVGVSGSAASAAALRWAVLETRARHGRLRIMLIWHTEPNASYAYRTVRPDPQGERDRALRVLADTVRDVLGPGLRRDTTTQVVEGTPERILVAESALADLLVLGSGPSRTIGPVVRSCLAEAHCPVVVVSQKVAPVRHPPQWLGQPGDADVQRPLDRRPVAAAT